jgi:general secretion pathway protein I
MNARRVMGFTLLEVMIAVAILGLSLAAIFSSQLGAVQTGARGRDITTATFLARCKMGEVEEQMATEGFPVVSAHGDDECCEGGEQEGFTCSWSVDRIVLPDAVDVGTDDPLAAAGGMTGDHEGDTASGTDVTNALAGAAGGDMLGSFAVQFAFPVIKPMIEDQVRRATVSVRWTSGMEENNGRGPCERGERNCFTIMQYIVADQGTDEEALPGQPDPNLDPNNPPPPGGT